jgi:diaminohydroxyphosphoribosylaminopyrimidine deaminase/5-amino-6-(5-phosphoribosylamino)uracil reductase
MTSEPEQRAMLRALGLADSVDLSRDPNPRVGAVVLSAAGDVVGTACHRGSGTAHAEVLALAAAGDAARGSTVVVTLEPCAHTGRTGPCADALIAAGVRRVVYAQSDPNPLAAGGARALRAAGVEVEGGRFEAEAIALNPHWTFAMTHARPFVTWKFAATLDGRSAASDGTSRWVSGPAARSDTHRLRATCDTILIGTGTIDIDNPQLTVRPGAEGLHPLEPAQQPRRAVMGLRALDPARRVFDDAAPTLRLRTRDPHEALGALFEQGSRRVWLEGGPTLGAAFLRAGLVDEVIVYVAPALLGAGQPAVGDLGITTIGDAVRLELDDVTRLGSDVRLTLRGSA